MQDITAFSPEERAPIAEEVAIPKATVSEGGEASAVPQVVSYRATREDVKAHIRYLQAGLFRLLLALFVAIEVFIWVLPPLCGGEADVLTGILSCALAVCLYAFLLVSQRRQIDVATERATGNTEYRIFDGYFEYRDLDEDGTVRTFYRVARGEVEAAAVLPEGLLVFRKGGISFCLPRERIGEDSPLWSIVFADGQPREVRRVLPIGKRRLALPCSRAFYEKALTVLCAVAALPAVCLMDGAPAVYWLAFVLLILPFSLICLVLYGIVKGERARVLPLLCVLLSGFVLLVSGVIGAAQHRMQGYWATVEPYFALAEVTEPVYSETWSEDVHIFDEEQRRYVRVHCVSAYLEQEGAQSFIESLTQDTRWMRRDDGALDGVFDEIADEYCDLYLLYNVTEATYNRDAISNEACDYVLFTFSGTYPSLSVSVFRK